jgi:N-acetylmuramoyl-L-alanine amidase
VNFGIRTAVAAASVYVSMSAGSAHAATYADDLVGRAAVSERGPMETQKACLAEAVFNEAGNEPMAGRMAVAHVILNRTRSGSFPTTVCGVVNQRGQFTYRRGRGVRPGYERQWAEARAVAALAMSGVMSNVVSSATFFRVARLGVPAAMRPIARIGGHVFFASRR